MTEIKLVGMLIKSLILWIVLLTPRILVYALGVLETSFRVLKETIKTFTEELKNAVLNNQ
jgi:hypothetical protein